MKRDENLREAWEELGRAFFSTWPFKYGLGYGFMAVFALAFILGGIASLITGDHDALHIWAASMCLLFGLALAWLVRDWKP